MLLFAFLAICTDIPHFRFLTLDFWKQHIHVQTVATG